MSSHTEESVSLAMKTPHVQQWGDSAPWWLSGTLQPPDSLLRDWVCMDNEWRGGVLRTSLCMCVCDCGGWGDQLDPGSSLQIVHWVFRGHHSDGQSLPGLETSDRWDVRGRVVAGPAVVSVGTRRISAPLTARAPSPLSPGLPGSFVAQEQRRRATVRGRRKMSKKKKHRKSHCCLGKSQIKSLDKSASLTTKPQLPYRIFSYILQKYKCEINKK